MEKRENDAGDIAIWYIHWYTGIAANGIFALNRKKEFFFIPLLL